MVDPSSTRRACVFCGSTSNKMSREHVWPEWVRNVLPETQRDRRHNYVFEDVDRGPFRHLEGQGPYEIRVREVCQPCNNGWMSEVECEAKPYLETMMKGGRRELHGIGQTKLAFWIALKALVAQLVFRNSTDPRRIDPQDYKDLYAARQDRLSPPDYLTIYTAQAAWSTNKAPNGFYRMTGLAREDSDPETGFDGYALTFSVLDFAGIVLRLRGDERGTFTRFAGSDDVNRAVGQIWPVRKTFVWPPGGALTAKGLVLIAGGEF